MTDAGEPPPLLAIGPPLPAARAVTILLHGRGRTPEEMVALAARFHLPEMTYLAPAAPGSSWYPQSFLAKVDENQPSLDQSLDRIRGLVSQVENRGIQKRKIALVGFSQGACLVAEYVFRQPAAWGAVALLTGGVIGPPDLPLVPSGDLARTPIYLGTSADDPWVPLERVRATAELFRAMNASVRVRETAGAEHAVKDHDVTATREALAEILGASPVEPRATPRPPASETR